MDKPVNNLLVDVVGISVVAPFQGYVLVLRERDGDRWLPIFVGAPEAQTLSLLLKGVKYVRPLTYDMFHSVLKAASVHIDRVTVTMLKDSTFFAEVAVICWDGETHTIDARPSDAIALALKTEAPVYVSEEVLAEAGMTGEIVLDPGKAQQDTQVMIKELIDELNKAVENENYEDAARIRDKIKALENKNNPNG